MPQHGAGVVVAPVYGAEPAPPAWQLKGLYNVLCPGEFPEKLPRQHVPIPVQVSPAQLLRQVFKLPEILRVGGDESRVIVYPCGYEPVVRLPLAPPVRPVYEQPLYPAVANATGVAGIVHAGEVPPHRPVAGGEKLHLLLGKVGSLLKAYHLVFLPLILVDVAGAVAVAKPQPAAVWELKDSLRRVVFCGAFELLQQRYDVVFPQLRQRPSHYKDIEAGIVQGEQHQLPAHGPALAAAPGPSVGRVPRRGTEKFRLLWVGNSLQFEYHTVFLLSENTRLISAQQKRANLPFVPVAPQPYPAQGLFLTVFSINPQDLPFNDSLKAFSGRELCRFA